MLAQAEARRATLPDDVAARLRFVRGDMRSLALGQSFDAVIATFFTLAHVQPATTWKQVFAGIGRHLKPGGRLAAHLPLVDKMAATPPPAGSLLFKTATPDGDSLALIFVEQSYTAKSGRFDLTLDYVLSSAAGVLRSRSRERYTLFHGDPLPFAERAGLRPAGEPMPLGTSGIIHIFEKAAG